MADGTLQQGTPPLGRDSHSGTGVERTRALVGQEVGVRSADDEDATVPPGKVDVAANSVELRIGGSVRVDREVGLPYGNMTTAVTATGGEGEKEGEKKQELGHAMRLLSC